jgi:protocatechuate 3,4-dioxygenase alpha subunit
MPGRTPSQTVGPFFSEALRWRDGGRVAFAEGGDRIVIAGRLLDGAGAPVPDALVETWQRSPTGAPPACATGDCNPTGFARVNTGDDGGFRIETAMPGGPGAPHLDVTILARGLLKALRTRVYLASEAQVRADPSLAPIAASPRLATLVATPVGGREHRWDVRLQGDRETVFFA